MPTRREKKLLLMAKGKGDAKRRMERGGEGKREWRGGGEGKERGKEGERGLLTLWNAHPYKTFDTF